MEQARPWYKEWFDSPGSLMLDIACGRGRNSMQLAEMGFDVTGIDLSENSILKAKENENDPSSFF